MKKFDKGIELLKKKDFTEARLFFTEEWGFYRALINNGKELISKKEYAESLDFFHEAEKCNLSKNERKWEASIYIAYVYFLLNDNENTKRILDPIYLEAKEKRSNFHPLFLLADIFFNIGENRKADELFSYKLLYKKDHWLNAKYNPESFINYGICKYLLNDFDNAEKILKSYLKFGFKNKPRVWYYLGLIYRKKKYYEAATECYLNELLIDENNINVKEELRQVNELRGNQIAIENQLKKYKENCKEIIWKIYKSRLNHRYIIDKIFYRLCPIGWFHYLSVVSDKSMNPQNYQYDDNKLSKIKAKLKYKPIYVNVHLKNNLFYLRNIIFEQKPDSTERLQAILLLGKIKSEEIFEIFKEILYSSGKLFYKLSGTELKSLIWTIGYNQNSKTLSILKKIILNVKNKEYLIKEAILSCSFKQTLESIEFLSEMQKNDNLKKYAKKSLKKISKKIGSTNYKRYTLQMIDNKEMKIRKAEKLVQQAEKKIDQGNITVALNLYSGAIKEVQLYSDKLEYITNIQMTMESIHNKEKVKSLQLQGVEKIKERNLVEALKIFSEALKILPDFKPVLEQFNKALADLIKKGKNLLKKGDIDQANEILEQARIFDEENLKIIELQTKISEEEEELKKRIEIKEKKKISIANLSFMEGKKLLEKLELEASVKKLDEALKLNPKDFMAKQIKEEVIEKIQNINKILEFIEKFEENIPVTLDRISKLANIEINKAEEAIKHILTTQQLLGRYLELEQVFIRKKDTKAIIEKEKEKYTTCYFCGVPLPVKAINCESCNNTILRCSVCKLPISFGDNIGKCSLCESVGHLNHLQEWVKIKGKCPSCMQDLPIEGIMQETTETKSK